MFAFGKVMLRTTSLSPSTNVFEIFKQGTSTLTKSGNWVLLSRNWPIDYLRNDFETSTFALNLRNVDTGIEYVAIVSICEIPPCSYIKMQKLNVIEG